MKTFPRPVDAPKTLRWICLALLAACGADQPPPAALRGPSLPDAWEKPDFLLTDTDGQPFDFRADTEGSSQFGGLNAASSMS